MCGLAGVVGINRGATETEAILSRILGVIRHRGPDSQKVVTGEGWGVAHARLAIIDVEGGAQPIWNEDRSIAIAGNNEIYNAPELRMELEADGHRFATRSDTEVALHGYEQWGEAVFAKLNGMFALAIFDTRSRRCVLARDPMGIKPLHLARTGSGFAFASEIKGLLEVPGVERRPDWDSMNVFLNLRYLPGEKTLFEGIERLEPGTARFLPFAGGAGATVRFFSLAGIRARTRPDFDHSSEELKGLLDRAISRHLLSDVEVAAYLSGGIDSSLVTALAAKRIPELRTFCVAFGEPTDETADARLVSERFGTNHEEITVGDSPLDHYREILWHVEEPKVNCVQGYLLAREAAKKVKVVLSGLGGDELYAGYVNNDLLYPMTLVSRLLGSRAAGRSLSRMQSLTQMLPGRAHADFLIRAAELGVNLRNPLQFYAILRNSFDHSRGLLHAIYAKPKESWKGMTVEALKPYFDRSNPDILNEILKLEARTKLVNDFLLTEDRVSMAHGLETRVPLLDRELVEHAFSLPSSFKYAPWNKKRILRTAARGWLPEDVFRKRKWGFSFNPYLLFQGQLGPFAREVLTRERVGEMGLFSWKWIREVLEAPPSPRLRWHYFNLWVMAGAVLWHDLFFRNGGNGGNGGNGKTEASTARL